jgi:peptidoglycan/LPS O-acetylase OafA/YrhL
MASAAVGGLESTAASGGERVSFPCFDGFRAIAALSVLVTHVGFVSGFNQRSRLGAFTARMDVGVAVFFVISGFLLYRPFVAARLDGRSAPGARPYFWRRALRILPAYWLALTLTIFVLHVPKQVPETSHLFLYYGLFHLYDVNTVVGPILSSYTLVTEVAFYLFLPAYAYALVRLRGSAERQVRAELLVLAGLFVASGCYRAVVTFEDYDPQRAGQLQNWLPGWIDAFAIGMALAVVSAWYGRRRARAPFGLGRRGAPALCWALAAAFFVTISLWIGRPYPGPNFFTHFEDLGIHYFYLAVAFFFLLPGIFGRPSAGRIRRLLQTRAVVALGLVSYGLYLWNESVIEKFVQWTGRAHPNRFPDTTPLWEMLAVVFVVTLAIATVSYVVVERPVLRLKNRVSERRPLPAPAA